jgi:acetolactate synthase-1/2/3 large subunit
MALGVVASDHPAFIGHGGLIAGDAVQQAFAQADVVLNVGCRFSSWLWDQRGPLVRPKQALINVDLAPSALDSPALHSVAIQADAPGRAGAGHRPRLASRCAGGVRRRPHQLLEQARRCAARAQGSTTPA